ncbi:MAG: ABC transporter substrate-binding protein [Ruminiclostridium sp.]|nr:ABC transporter substrate-binding protein [Ruminiclostridium sp.]
MLKRFIVLFTAVALMITLAACTGITPLPVPQTSEPVIEETSGGKEASGSVMLYSSLKEAQLDAIKTGFMSKYPGIKMDYYAAGTSKVATKLATEKQSGQIACDVVWVGDPSNYITFKEQGILEAYESPEASKIDTAFRDPDNYFVGARLVAMGFAYNTNTVTEENAPRVWNDLLKEEFRNQIVMTDPGESGTTFYLVAGMMSSDKYGVDFFKKLKEYGTELESGTTSTHTKVAANAYKVCIAVDYVTQTLEKDGSTIKFVYPDEDLIAISSPIALIKGSKNQENARLLYDFILSVEGQRILADNDCSPIRSDVIKEGALSIEQIIARSMAVDDAYIADHDSEILSEYDSIFK